MTWNKRGVWYILGMILAVIFTTVPLGDFLGFFITSFLLTLYFHKRKGEVFGKSEIPGMAAIVAGLLFAGSLLVILFFQPQNFSTSVPFLIYDAILRFLGVYAGIFIYSLVVNPKQTKMKVAKIRPSTKKPAPKPTRWVGPVVAVAVVLIIALIIGPAFIHFLDRDMDDITTDNKEKKVEKEYNIGVGDHPPLKCHWMPSQDFSSGAAGDGSYRCQGYIEFDFNGLPLEAGTQLQLWMNNNPFGLPGTRYYQKLTLDKDLRVTNVKFVYNKVVSDWFQSRRPPCPAGTIDGLTLEIFEYSVGAKRIPFHITIPITC